MQQLIATGHLVSNILKLRNFEIKIITKIIITIKINNWSLETHKHLDVSRVGGGGLIR